MGHYTNNLNHTSDRWSTFERLRVDVAQTGFFEGREFRSYKELNIAALTTYVMKIVVPVNIIIQGLDVQIEAGWLRLSSHVGGTEGGSFSETLPIRPKNNMTAGKDHRATYNGNNTVYLPVVVITAGGTHTGGTELDVSRLKASGNTQQGSSVGQSNDDSRGIGPATYYFRLQNLHATDAITGVFQARWEERP